jgi:hypothetical protein
MTLRTKSYTCAFLETPGLVDKAFNFQALRLWVTSRDSLYSLQYLTTVKIKPISIFRFKFFKARDHKWRHRKVTSLRYVKSPNAVSGIDPVSY